MEDYTRLKNEVVENEEKVIWESFNDWGKD